MYSIERSRRRAEVGHGEAVSVGLDPEMSPTRGGIGQSEVPLSADNDRPVDYSSDTAVRTVDDTKDESLGQDGRPF